MSYIDDIGSLVVRSIQATLIVKNRVASGQALESVNYSGVGSIISIFATDYFPYIDKGRPAGGLPPVNKLIDWVIVRGIAVGREATSIGWAIAKTIERQGVPTRNSRTQLNVVQETIDDITPEITRIANEGIKEQINTRIRNIFAAQKT